MTCAARDSSPRSWTCCATRARGVTSRTPRCAPPRSTSATQAVPEGSIVVIDVDLEAVNDSIVFSGTVRRPWAGCAGGASGRRTVTIAVRARAVRRSPAATPRDEAFPIEGDSARPRARVREALLLELPLAPLCRPTAPGCARHAVSIATRSTAATEPTGPIPGGVRSTASSAGRGSTASVHWLASLHRPARTKDRIDGRPQEEDVEVEEPQPPGLGLALDAPARSVCPRCGARSCRTSCAAPAAGTRAARPSTSTTQLGRNRIRRAPGRLDAMGGDQAPGEIVAGARAGGRGARHPGRARRSGGCRRRERVPDIAASEVIAMGDDPAPGRAPQEGLVAGAGRRGGARRQGVGHGVAPATPAPPWRRALLRMGRIKGVTRPAIATPIPVPGRARRPSCSTPAPTPSASPSGWCSSPRWARSSPGSATASAEPAGRPAVDRRGADEGQPAGEGDPRAARRPTPGRATSSATSRAATS